MLMGLSGADPYQLALRWVATLRKKLAILQAYKALIQARNKRWRRKKKKKRGNQVAEREEEEEGKMKKREGKRRNGLLHAKPSSFLLNQLFIPKMPSYNPLNTHLIPFNSFK